MIGFRANNRQRVIGTFCNFHMNSKQRETNEDSGEDRCMTTLITAAKETTCLVNMLNMLGTNGTMILTLGSAFYVNKQLLLVSTYRRYIKKMITSGHDFGKIK